MQQPDLATLRSRLAATPGVIEALLGTLPADALHFREAEGSWTPFQVVCHLIDAEENNWIPRTRIVLAGGSSTFAPFDREAGLRRYASLSLDALIAEFSRRRRASLDTLESLGLKPADLSREGQHPDFGTVTLGQLLSTWVAHDHAHVAQICRALVHHYGAGVGPWKAFFRYLRDR
jgi:uncharacterized damage-inducible protein DinB